MPQRCTHPEESEDGIQDELVKSRILQNDGWANIIGFSDSFAVDKQDPRIEVRIIEVDE